MRRTGESLRELFSLIGIITPSSFLFNSSNKIILPTYHTVSDQSLPHIKNLYKVKSAKEFTKDLDNILKQFTPIDLQTLISITHNKEKITKNLFHLSFDDGLRESEEIISPILKRKGIPATFFINPSFIDNKDLMHRYKVSVMIENIKGDDKKKNKISQLVKRKLGIRRDAIPFLLTLKYPHKRFTDEIAGITEIDFNAFLINQKPYLTSSQINNLCKDGFTVGAHSMDHPEYMMLSYEEQIRQTFESITFIKKKFHTSYQVFAFPFTDYLVTKKVFDAIYNQGAADLTFGVAGIKNDYHPFHLQRIPMEKRLSSNAIIKGEYLYYYLKSLFGKNQIKRK